MPDKPIPIHPLAVISAVYALAVALVVLLERHASQLLEKQAAAGGTLPREYAASAGTMNIYLGLRESFLAHWLFYGSLCLAAPVLLFAGLKWFAATQNRSRARQAGMEFTQPRYDLVRQEGDLVALIAGNLKPAEQVVLGLGLDGKAIYLTDKSRETHVHVLGETGTGKTKSCLEPLMYQDLQRGRGVMVVDAKGAQENEEQLASLTSKAGRLDALKVFTLNPGRLSHTYNPMHLVGDANPQAVAERVFSSFADDMDNPYYRDQSRMFFVKLAVALAGTGKPFHMLDIASAIASPEILDYALQQSSDAAAKRAIQSQMERLGRKAGETFTGLLAAVERYDHPSLSVVDPDIVLEREMDESGVVGFFLQANYFKQLARYVGLVVFQHIQQLGSLRQMDRSRPQTPVYLYADEFYTFAYEGFTDAVNKLRDAKIAIHLAHQSISDLEKVSPEFAQGIWDNTRIKVCLKQQNPELCERLSKSLGTEKGMERTLRRSADAFLNETNMLEASTKEVDQYRLHPTRIKMLRTFQAFVTEDAQFQPVNLQMLPKFPPARPPQPKKPVVEGLGLHNLYVTGALPAAPLPDHDEAA